MKIKRLIIDGNEVIVKIIGEVLRAFHIEIADVDADFDEFKISNRVIANKVSTRLEVDGKTFGAFDFIKKNEKRSGEIHRIIKKNLYEILTGNFNLRGVPYGIMHGVRPTKIIHRWIRNNFGVTSQGVIDRDKISRRLRADYLTSFEKSLLLTEVAVRQLPILNSSDDKSISVYVGIPFCVTRCLYCSFPSNILPSAKKISEFMKVLASDIDAAADEIKRYNFKVQNIYIGVGVGLGVAVGVAVGGTGGTGSGGEPRNSSSAAMPAATSTAAHRTAISHFRGLRSLRPEGDGEKPSPKKGSAPNEAKSSCWSAPCSILPDGESGIENSTFSSVGRLSSGGKNQSDTFFTPEFACMATRRLFHFQKPKPPKSWLPDGLPPRAGERPELAP